MLVNRPMSAVKGGCYRQRVPRSIWALMVALLLPLGAPSAAPVPAGDRFKPFRQINMSNATLGPLIVQIEATDADDIEFIATRLTLRRADGTLIQRINVPGYPIDRGTVARNIVALEIGSEGAAILWVPHIDFESRNPVWLSFVFDTKTRRYIEDRSWTQPSFDVKTGCVAERTNGGHAGGIALHTITCRKAGRWLKMFVRDQTKFRYEKDANDCRVTYFVKQSDWRGATAKHEKFALPCPDWFERAPPWVARLYKRAKSPYELSKKR